MLEKAGTSAKGLKPVGDLQAYRTMNQAQQALERRALAEAVQSNRSVQVAAAAPAWWVAYRMELAAGAAAATLLLALVLWRRA